MAKRFIDTDIFKKPYIRGLQAPYKLLWLYILTDCNHAGLWDVEIDVAQLKLGVKVKESDALIAFAGKVIVVKTGEKWFIPSFIEFQYGKLNPENRAHASVINLLSAHNLYFDGELVLLGKEENKGLTSPSEGCKDIDKDKELDKDKEVARVHPLQDFIKTLKTVSQLKTQITFEECETLISLYPKELIKEKLNDMENHVPLLKKYKSVYLTLNTWCKLAQSKSIPVNEKQPAAPQFRRIGLGQDTTTGS